ncbi:MULTISPECIES: tRNA (adenosine(37)-N6)-dimethylallyltransferase MiaA [Butyricimonas]|uniref:tRNA (adenosine(37)-N6)-dimethylallyltransferase MiaA n=1 Tax=Butyricimonas TaxID=574697 RepID=UPI001D069797|nr:MULTISPECIES: tRNA (adenosine(37)-N6)-dimethylallyltransferase MiaA [Butyricimonas]MCB6972089.1 tRNA (adenosine(37)-N6)-dimethylallyltransferase MiaA [Butyricimonas synergistica]MCG4519097.1 tRNA (adenosine(37)-N6)-dimethylallyltransferase MiaA [Butyricimonas sp. DFI.6.44]
MKTLLVLLGPTGVGKTDLSIELARHYRTSVISCDSRQIYKEMNIGTAVPEREQLAAVPHFFIQTVSVRDYFNCWEFEQQALRKIRELFEERDVVVMAGGSMMYIDAVCKGIDEMPTIDDEVRASVKEMFERDGIEALRLLLKKLDPEWYARVDLKNGKRVMHALEVCLMTGKPYSSFLTRTVKEREFNIVKIGLNREREELFDRINRRVDIMVESGMEEEARALYPLRHLNALNTVGYKEWFDYFDGKFDREEAIRLIKRNTRRYAKKQLTWYRNDPDIHWFHPSQKEEICSILNSLILD